MRGASLFGVNLSLGTSSAKSGAKGQNNRGLFRGFWRYLRAFCDTWKIFWEFLLKHIYAILRYICEKDLFSRHLLGFFKIIFSLSILSRNAKQRWKDAQLRISVIRHLHFGWKLGLNRLKSWARMLWSYGAMHPFFTLEPWSPVIFRLGALEPLTPLGPNEID